MKFNRINARIKSTRWVKYSVAFLAGSGASLTPHSSVDADFTFIEVNSFIQDRSPGNSYFDVFGPYTFGAPGASLSFLQASQEIGSTQGILAVRGIGNLSVGGYSLDSRWADNIPYGNFISTHSRFLSNSETMAMAWGFGYSQSEFLEPGIGYVGFRFNLGNGTQYGYAEVIVSGTPLNTATLVGFGWADAGEAVFAGQRQIPEPNCLGMLALGGIAILNWRRSRRREALFEIEASHVE